MPLGYKLRRLLDNVRALRRFKQLTSHDAWTREQLEAHQRLELEQLERHAAAHSAFWRDRLEAAPPPVLDKATLMERFDEAVTDPRLRLARLEEHLVQLRGDELLDGEFRVVATSGTTGVRGVFAYSRAEWALRIANALRMNAYAGFGVRRRRVGIVGATDPRHISARFGMSSDIGLHRLSRLDARNPLGETVAALNKHRPDQLVGYPSIVALLAEEQSAGRLAIQPSAISTIGEVRTEGMERAVRDAWPHARLHNFYAVTEAGILAADCEHRAGMHLFEDLAIFENVDERGEPVPEGEVGANLLVTDLAARAQPKLRYAVSDSVAITSEPCACGRPYRRLLSLAGRSDDILEVPAAAGGTVRVHPLALRSPMAGQARVLQYQMVHDRDGLHVVVVPRGGAGGPDLEREVQAALGAALEALGACVPLHVHVVDALPRDQGHGAKVKLVTSRVGSRPTAPR